MTNREPGEKTPRKPGPRGRWQFSLAKLWLLMLLAGVVFTCVGGWYHEFRSRKEAMKELEAIGGKLSITASTAPGVKPDTKRQSLTFLKPLGDLDLRRMAPYWKWLSEVREVSLANTAITSAGVESLRDLPHLEHLDLSGTRINDDALRALAQHEELQSLILDGTQLTDAGLAPLGQLPALKSLSLSGTPIGDPGLAHLAGSVQLEELILAKTRLTDAGAVHLRRLGRLAELDLTGTPIGDPSLSHIRRLTNLQRLSLESTSVSDLSIVPLRRLTSLESLTLLHTRFTPSGLSRLQRAMPRVKLTQ